MKHKYVILILMVVLCMPASAQYDPEFSHYFDMEPSFNAGSVGKESKLNIAAAYAIQMAGYEHNPNTMYASADLPFRFMNMMHGAGLQFMNDQIGLFKHMKISLQYAPKFNMLGGTMSVGVQVGLLSETFDGSKVDVDDLSDPALATSEVKGNVLDLGAGIYYKHKYWYAGLSAQHLTAPLVSLGETYRLRIDRSYYLTGGGDIKFRTPNWKLKPSFLVRTDLKSWREDISLRLHYTHEKKMMYIGLGYSPLKSATLFIGGNIHGVVLGYSYEMYTNGVGVINGSHELCLGYQMDMNFGKKGRNKHQAVRIL